ncbi:hypothetical protein SSOG_07614 [Streptomyces himastatinicus ATCC 53653]|uniref:Uncharacterized protein n=1 Tax=Streptomyces himastatinicus ATCC 53653 TaxID=457427 RepID=D9WMN4_9ACTN|nr:hypothetical protein [Streptomyces himastatinicus]EFL27900.1 hypothetical protein SSOG_07614 [Streptomyces himastatinicus ATCC 53653]
MTLTTRHPLMVKRGVLAGALPVIWVLRWRPPRILDRIYAWAYVGLLTVVMAAMALSGVSG